MLNNFWGKFSQRENKTQTVIVTNPTHMYRLLNDPAIVVECMTIIDDETLLVTWNRAQEEIRESKNMNVVIAAVTTAAARLRLYEYLEKLDRRVLYFDTDSIIFTRAPNEWTPPLGDYLGDSPTRSRASTVRVATSTNSSRALPKIIVTKSAWLPATSDRPSAKSKA